MKRKRIRLEEKLASALYEVGLWRSRVGAFGAPNNLTMLVGLRHMKASAELVCSHFQWDHNILHAHGGPDLWWNITPLPIPEHKEKTKKDLGIIAKGKRIAKKQAAHKVKAAKGNADVLAAVTTHLDKVKDGKLNYLAVYGLPKIKRAWPKRPFPKRKTRHK